MKIQEVKIDLGEQKLNSKFVFKYPIPKPLKVDVGCYCTNYSYDGTHINFTISTPTEIPFQITAPKWVKTLTPSATIDEDTIVKFTIKYFILNE